MAPLYIGDKMANATAVTVNMTTDEKLLCYNALGSYATIVKRRINAEVNIEIKKILVKELDEVVTTQHKFA